MKRARISLISVLTAVGLIAAFAITATSQTRDRFVISAKAGGVNAVTGGASVRTRGGSEWQLLTIREDLETGDVVKTGHDGRVEMLLNPGSYLRVGENSEFELSNNALDNLEVKLLRGTAIVEATGAEDTAMWISITTPHTKIAIVRRGLYRLNVVPGDNTELIVRKGRAMHEASHTRINGGNKVIFNADTFSIAKLNKADKKRADSLDNWSEERADMVAEANKKIRGRELTMLMTSMDYRWNRMFSAANAGGFWLFNPRYGCYTFMPFYMGWGSPYGGGYSQSFYPFYWGNYCCGQGRGYYGNPTANNPTGTVTSNTGPITNPPPTSNPGNPGGMLGNPNPGGGREISPAAERRIDRHAERLPNAP